MEKIEIISIAILSLIIFIILTILSDNYVSNVICVISVILILIPTITAITKRNEIKSLSNDINFKVPLTRDLSYVHGLYNTKFTQTENIITSYGLVIEITRLIKENFINVKINENLNDSKEKITLKINKNNLKNIKSTDKLIIDILRIFDKTEVNFKSLDEQLNNISTIKKFQRGFENWRMLVEKKNHLKEGKYFSRTNRNFLVIITIMIITYAGVTLFLVQNVFTCLIQGLLLITYFFLVLNYDKYLGNYTKKGIEVLTNLNSVNNYLKSPNLIKKYPPDDWDLFLLYSTCFHTEKQFLEIMCTFRNPEKNDLQLFIENNGVAILSEIFKKALKKSYIPKKRKKDKNEGVDVAELLPPVYLLEAHD